MIAAIENAIIARLQAASDAPDLLGYKFKTLGSFPQNWREYKAKYLGQTTAPAAWITFGGANIEAKGDNYSTIKARFGLVLCARNFRNEKSTRHGSAGEIGSYQLLEDATGILAGQTFGLNILPIQPRSWSLVDEDTANYSFLVLELATEFTIENNYWMDDADLNDFSTFAVDWGAPPISEIITLPTGDENVS